MVGALRGETSAYVHVYIPLHKDKPLLCGGSQAFGKDNAFWGGHRPPTPNSTLFPEGLCNCQKERNPRSEIFFVHGS